MNVKETWNKCLMFWDEAHKLRDESEKLWDKRSKHYDERNKFYDEAEKLWNERNKLLDNIIKYYEIVGYTIESDKIILSNGVILYYNSDIYFPLKVIMKEVLKKGKE